MSAVLSSLPRPPGPSPALPVSLTTMGPPRGSFAELVALAERTGQSEVLPLLARAGARNIDDLTARSDTWVAAGVSPLALEAMLAAPPLVEESSTLALVGAGPSRPDLPVRRDATRASLAAAVEAVRPANVKRAVTELRDNMLAKSTRGPTSPGSGLGIAWRLKARSPPGPSLPGP